MSKLQIGGEVRKSLSLSFEDLSRMGGQVEDVAKLVPGREGQAVRLTTVLESAAPSANARYITLEAEGGSFSASVPLDALREGLLVYRLGNAPLPASKGGPVRFLLPNAESCGGDINNCVNVKFLERIILGTKPGKDSRPKSKKAHDELHETPGHEHLKK